MDNPLVSVILPCYNAQQFIASAIESIKDQTLKSWELIIVDDGSIDASADIIRQHLAANIILIHLKSNKGYPSAMNSGIAAARGEFIARMDADDICLPARLEEQVKALKKYPDASFCGLNRFRITPGGEMYVDR